MKNFVNIKLDFMRRLLLLLVLGVILAFGLLSCNITPNKNNVSSIDSYNKSEIPDYQKYFTLVEITKNEYLNLTKRIKNISYEVYNVKKHNDTLIIPLDNKKPFIRIDRHDKETGLDEIHEINGFYKDINCYYYSYRPYDATWDSLISKKDGSKTFVCGVPILSPNHKTFICYSKGILYDVKPNCIQLFFIDKSNFTLKFEYSPKNWEPNNICWFDDNTLLLEQIYYNNLETLDKSIKKYFKIILRNNEIK